ncbi:hypothetical protein AMECASPLE_036546, partial [Ameca splendens]
HPFICFHEQGPSKYMLIAIKSTIICQTLNPARRRLKLHFQSEADLTNPQIQQQILEQLNSDELKDFKLRWIETDGLAFCKQSKRRTKSKSSLCQHMLTYEETELVLVLQKP